MPDGLKPEAIIVQESHFFPLLEIVFLGRFELLKEPLGTCAAVRALAREHSCLKWPFERSTAFKAGKRATVLVACSAHGVPANGPRSSIGVGRLLELGLNRLLSQLPGSLMPIKPVLKTQIDHVSILDEAGGFD